MHALVRDEHGAKMSKSKGNVIDPLDMVEEFSADVVRFSLCYLAVQGRDIKLGKKHLETYRNFTNKLYNASNFLQLNHDKFCDLKDIEIKTPLGRYMQTRFIKATKLIVSALESYKFNEAASGLYNFVWNEFCDFGIEYSKADKDSILELGAIFKETLKLISPFMPFIADFLYHKLNGSSIESDKSLMVMNFPNISNMKLYENEERNFFIIGNIIKTIRRAKITIDKANSKIAQAYIKFDNSSCDIKSFSNFIEKLAKVENISFVDSSIDSSISEVGDGFIVYLPTNQIDIGSIEKKYNNQKEKLQKEIDKLNVMLKNKKFIENAPDELIEQNRLKASELQTKIIKIDKELLVLSK
jgi:valyl-tRNA synthetase